MSAISLSEVAAWVRKGRLALPSRLDRWFRDSFARSGIQLLPITPEIASDTLVLPQGFQGDPADRLIASTARVEDLTVSTRDKELLRFGRSGRYRTLQV